MHVLHILIRFTLVTPILVTAFVSIVFASYGKDVESSSPDTARQEEQVQVQSDHKKSVDPFTLAIIGMSLGCMCVASSVHWTLSQRNRLERSIQSLDDFLASNCAVEFHLAGRTDNDPMLHMVKEMETNQDALLREHADQHDEMVKRISAIEAEIMRIWG